MRNKWEVIDYLFRDFEQSLTISPEDLTEEIVKLIEEDKNLLFEKTPIFGDTLLNLACKTKKNADDLVIELIQLGSNINEPGCLEMTPLHNAASYNKLSTCKILTNYGADHNIRDESYDLPIETAFRYGSIELMRYFIKKYPDGELDEFTKKMLTEILQFRHNMDPEKSDYWSDTQGVSMYIENITPYIALLN